MQTCRWPCLTKNMNSNNIFYEFLYFRSKFGNLGHAKTLGLSCNNTFDLSSMVTTTKQIFGALERDDRKVL